MAQCVINAYFHQFMNLSLVYYILIPLVRNFMKIEIETASSIVIKKNS